MQKQFIAQIKEDIITIRNLWRQNDSKLESDYYAFNYWVLNYLYHIDLDFIQDNITEYSDKGIDCFIHYEDAKELYIIQNYFYAENTNLDRKSISDFLISPLHYLSLNNYSRSKILQDIFNKIKDDNEYTIYLYCYITKRRTSISKDILSLFENFSSSFEYKFSVEVKLLGIDEIQNIYEGDRFDNVISFKYSIKTFRRSILDQSSEQHDKEYNVNTAYLAVNIFEIYKMIDQSKLVGYDLFDKNIREYLGLKGKRAKTNKDMLATLLDDIERKRFFYYNNGITLICDEFSKKKISNRTYIEVVQPQIVNGCQTVNTIFAAINSFMENNKESKIISIFKHCSVLLKIFKVNKTNDIEKRIYENIVKYTNTQAGISAKDFVSKNDYFLNLQDDFLKRGFYLIVKQSDKHKFESDKKLFDLNKKLSEDVLSVFSKTATKPSDLFIELDKMLKCLMAFYFDGYTAFKNSASILNEHSSKYYINFSKKIRLYFTTGNMINLYLTYSVAGGTKVARTVRFPIPYYMMDFIGRNLKNDVYDFIKVNNKLDYMFSSKDIFNEINSKFWEIIEDYSEDFMDKNCIDYSTMTKNREIDANLVDKYIHLKIKDATRNDWSYFLEFLS